MRWSLIAIGILSTALLGFAFGRPEPRHPLLPPRAELAAGPPVETPPPPPPPPAPAPSGASILSLIEVGPAEVEPVAAGPVAAPEPAPAPAPVKPSGRTAEDWGTWLRQRRPNRTCQSAVWVAIRNAVDKCRGPQLARSPRLQGDVRIEVAVQAQPGQAYGLLRFVEVDSFNMYMPLFKGCIQSAIAAVSFPNPGSQIQAGYSFTLQHDAAPSEPDDDDSEGSDDGDDATNTTG